MLHNPDHGRAPREEMGGASDLERWALEHGIHEAYRVTREPSSHGGLEGWQVTLWRSRRGYCADRTALYFPERFLPVTRGFLLSRRSAERLLGAVDRANLWTAPPWPRMPGLDGYTVVVEALRDARAVRREAWGPDPVIRHHAWEIFQAFGAIRTYRLLWWRRVPAGA